MNLIEKIKKREIKFETKEIFDVSDTFEIISNNYKTILNEIQLLKEELKKISSVNYDKSIDLENIISIYKNLKDELIEILNVFRNSMLTYEEKKNIIIRFGKDYEIRKQLKMKQCKFLNKVIYHYTSFQNFINIVQTKQLRFSELGKSNDPNEGKVLREKIEDKKLKDYFTKLISEYEKNEYKSYICSFSKHKEYKCLSLWRGYGDNCKGIALGFKIKEALLTDKKFYLYGNEMREIIYSKNNLFKDNLYRLKKYVEITDKESEDKQYLYIVFKNYSCFFKKYWFKDEREIRLVKILENKSINDGYVIPVIEEYQKNSNNLVFAPGGYFYPLCFNEVIIGSKNSCNENTIRAILNANGYSNNIKIKKSKIEFS